MSLNLLLKSSLLVLAASVLSAFALGLSGHIPWLAAFAALYTASFAFLTFLIFRRVLAPLRLLTSTMKGAFERGLAMPELSTEMPADEFGEIAVCCNRLYAEIEDMTGMQEQIFSSLTEPAVKLDREGNITSLNMAAVAAGLPGSLAGRPFKELLAPDVKTAFQSTFILALGGEPAGSTELPLTLDGGITNLFLFNAVPLRRNGAVTGVMLIGKDMDEQKKLTDELDAIRSEARAAADKLNKTIRELEEFALMAVKREIKMKEIREKLTELREDRGARGAKADA